MVETNEQHAGGFLSRLPYYSLIALIASLGFFQIGYPLLGKSVVVTDLLFLVTAAVCAIAVIGGQLQLRWDPFYWVAILYLATLGISIIFSADPPRSLTTFPIEVYLAALSFITFSLLDNRRRIETTISAWLIGTAFSVAVGLFSIALFYLDRGSFLLEYLTYHYGAVPVGDFPRITATFASASMFCNYLNVGLVMAVMALQQKNVRPALAFILILGISLCSLFTISIGLGGIFLALGVLGLVVYRHNRTATRLFAAAGIVAALAFIPISAFALAYYPNAEVWATIANVRLMPSSRVLVWRDALQTFFQHPSIGNGLGLPVANTTVVNTDGSMSLLTDAHNSFLNVAAQSGVLGLFGLLSLVVYLVNIWIKSTRTNDTVARALGLAFVCSFVYQGLTGSFEEARHLWVLMGIIVAANRSERNA